MFTLKLLFKKPKEQCPRCLGKGTVDWNDIERLHKKLVWLPGKCAYCNGNGKVHEETLSIVPADISYLSANLSKIERWKILSGDKNARKRVKAYEEALAKMIDKIARQYYVDGLDLETIVDIHFASLKNDKVSPKERQDFLEYTKKVVEFHKNKFS
jgi:hypothetical protein